MAKNALTVGKQTTITQLCMPRVVVHGAEDCTEAITCNHLPGDHRLHDSAALEAGMAGWLAQ